MKVVKIMMCYIKKKHIQKINEKIIIGDDVETAGVNGFAVGGFFVHAFFCGRLLRGCGPGSGHCPVINAVRFGLHIFVAVFRRNTGREVGQEREARPFPIYLKIYCFAVMWVVCGLSRAAFTPGTAPR